MPSWEIHEKVAKTFGIPEGLAKLADEVIDRGILHDIGRRIPRIGVYARYFCEEKQRVLENVEEELRKLTLSNDGVKAFWLHHALDLLSERLASAYLTDSDPLNLKDYIISAVQADLRGLSFDFKKWLERRRIHVNIYLPQDFAVEPVYNEIVLMPELKDWLSENVIQKRKLEEKERLEETLLKDTEEIVNSTTKYISSRRKNQVPTLKDRVSAATKEDGERFLRGELLSRVLWLALIRSKIWDYLLLSGKSKEYIVNMLGKVSKGEGKWVLRYAEKGDFSLIIKELGGTLGVFKIPVQVPEESLRKFSETLLSGYKIVEKEYEELMKKISE